MARQLRAEGEAVGLLVVFDASPANAGYEKMTWWKPLFGLLFLRNLYFWLCDFAAIPSPEGRRFLRRKVRALSRRLAALLTRQKRASKWDLEGVIDPTQFRENELRLSRICLQGPTPYRPVILPSALHSSFVIRHSDS